MTAAMKPRVAAERWVARKPPLPGFNPDGVRAIKCEFTAWDLKWHVLIYMPEHGVSAQGIDPDFHVAMAKAWAVVQKTGRRHARLARKYATKNKRTSRRARRTSRRAA